MVGLEFKGDGVKVIRRAEESLWKVEGQKSTKESS